MKHQKLLVCCALGATTLGAASTVRAWPSGPAAKQAARLKYNPPANYLAHYLPDDRYKIAGNVWKTVSTQLDTYYHRADCPNMRRQPADIVIGFAGAKDAEEAGYTPDPTCSPQATAFIFPVRGSKGVAGNALVLADGKSYFVLPPGWSRRVSEAQELMGIKFTRDILTAPGGGKVEIGMIDLGANSKMDLGQYLTPAAFERNRKQFQQGSNMVASTGNVNNQLSGMLGSVQNDYNRVKVASAKIGGLSGLSFQTKGGPLSDGSRRGYVVGKGSQMWVITDYTRNGAGLNSLVKTFRPR